MEDEDKPDKLTENLKAVSEDTDELIAALYEAIERFATGNPRFTKKERQIYGKFLSRTISDVAILMRLLKGTDELRLSHKNILKQLKETFEQKETIIIQFVTIMRGVRELILDGRQDDAIAMITKIVNRYDDDGSIIDC